MSVFAEMFLGVPTWAQILFWFALAVAVASLVSVLVLLVAARRYAAQRARRHGPLDARAEDAFLWVFLVPALNEEVTIADSVARLRATQASNALFIVIDDGSDDRTGEILAGIADPRLRVLTRVAPDARKGKAAALNAAYRFVRDRVLNEPEFAQWGLDRVVIGVVDADGRLAPDAPRRIGRHFLDASVGGVQTLVRIYNRRGWLTWAQDVEFSSFGLLFQAGRSRWGTANMGGNGQFNRLAALESVADGEGPWRHRLTEDQDLGVRLIQSGWAGVQENGATIDQQGLNSLRRLYRQRVRWAQGSWQALGLLGGAARPWLPLLGLVDAVFYLLTPILQLVVGTAFVTSVALWVFDGAPYRPSYWWVLIFFVAVSFGPGLISIVLRGGRWYSPFVAVVQIVPYTVYSWIVFPVVAVSLVRQLSGRTSWAKTAREQVDDAADAAGSVLVRGR